MRFCKQRQIKWSQVNEVKSSGVKSSQIKWGQVKCGQIDLKFSALNEKKDSKPNFIFRWGPQPCLQLKVHWHIQFSCAILQANTNQVKSSKWSQVRWSQVKWRSQIKWGQVNEAKLIWNLLHSMRKKIQNQIIFFEDAHTIMTSIKGALTHPIFLCNFALQFCKQRQIKWSQVNEVKSS